MKVFSSLKNLILFRGKQLPMFNAPVIDEHTSAQLLPALEKLVPVCHAVPGMHFTFDVCDGQLAVLVNWKTESVVKSGRTLHYTVSEQEGVKEITSAYTEMSELANENSKQVIPAAHAPQTLSNKESEPQSTHQPNNLMRKLSDFLTTRYHFRFNLLTEETEVTALEATIPAEHQRYEKVDDRHLNSLCMDAMEAGIPCWDRDIQRFVRSNRVEDFHPFTAYFDNLPKWDGTDRITPLAQRVSDNSVWVNGFHRWMLGTAAQWMKLDTNGRANSVAPLLVSSTQGLGKSTFCRMLLPETLKHYYSESFDLNAPSASEAKLAAYGLINLDEFDKLGASKMPLLKNLMQMSALNIRKAYKRSASPLHRIASFIGTSNREDLLIDRTGSRRFLCVNIDHAIDCNTPVEHDQLYAQLKAELLSGERHWFDKEEEQAIQRNNALFYKHVPEEEVFRLCFRFATEEESTAKTEQLTAAQIYEEMKKKHPAAMRGMTAYSLSRVLPQLGERIHTVKGNVYRVVRE